MIYFFIISISNEQCTALVMKMSSVEGSADQDCRVHHKSGGNQEVRPSHPNFWQVNQIEEVTLDSEISGTPTTRLNFPLLLSWSWMLKEGNFSFFGWTQFAFLCLFPIVCSEELQIILSLYLADCTAKENFCHQRAWCDPRHCDVRRLATHRLSARRLDNVSLATFNLLS